MPVSKVKYILQMLKKSTEESLQFVKLSTLTFSNLRADSLSQLLCYSNVMSGSTVAVVESCHGLVLGSVMERLGGRSDMGSG